MYLEKEEMKFTAVYAVKHYKAPISESRLYEIFTWDKDIMEYFDLAEVLSELIEDEYICKKFYRNQEALCLTQKGEEAYRYFKSRIPASIRARIDNAIGRIKYDEVADPNAVLVDVVYADDEQYMAKCRIMDEKVPIIELNINMGSRAYAQRAADYFKKNSRQIYEDILKLFDEA